MRSSGGGAREMRDHVLVGRDRQIQGLSRADWESEVVRAPEICAERLRFMDPDHHKVRYFVVEELARRGSPLSIGAISAALSLGPEVVTKIVAELERNLFFLVRNEDGEISWAYPVTVDRTPHRLTFSTGERLYGA
jgi:hypothetical protein